MNKEEVGIRDHVLIGNCRSAALVSKAGKINWCCIPEFHSPAIFAALLDKEKGGSFALQPVGEYDSTQEYIEDTNVAQTIFHCKEGTVKVIDCFVAMTEEEKKKRLFPDMEILRIVQGVSGSVLMECEYQPRTFYGKKPVRLRNFGSQGIHFTYRENIFILQTTATSLEISEERKCLTGEFVVKEDETVVFSLSCSPQAPAIIPEIKSGAMERLQGTIAYWKNWISKCKYEGISKSIVRRSTLALKLQIHAPSGAIIAAPTTSLPEELGGERNWDYRFCWLRDASFTINVLIKLGYKEEAHAYMSWILHATRLTHPKLQVVYTVFGNTQIKEKPLNWLKGYKSSAPVRVGNDAHGQFQLDIYGEVLNAVYAYSGIVKEFDNATTRFILGLGKTICKYWKEPDEGIWEIRSQALQHTHSKVIACTGLESLIRICRKYKWKQAPLEHFEKTREEISRSIDEFGFDRELGAYKRTYEGTDLDASSLLFPLVGYCDAGSPGMMATVDKIKEKLVKKGFVYRYRNTDDGLSGTEGAFVVAGFWLMENLALSGKSEEALKLFQDTINILPKHQLLSEEIDPDTKEFLGNYPQAYSHIGLIDAAITISESIMRKEGGHTV